MTSELRDAVKRLRTAAVEPFPVKFDPDTRPRTATAIREHALAWAAAIRDAFGQMHTTADPH